MLCPCERFYQPHRKSPDMTKIVDWDVKHQHKHVQCQVLLLSVLNLVPLLTAVVIYFIICLYCSEADIANRMNPDHIALSGAV